VTADDFAQIIEPLEAVADLRQCTLAVVSYTESTADADERNAFVLSA
jgi:hypothetical protein